MTSDPPSMQSPKAKPTLMDRWAGIVPALVLLAISCVTVAVCSSIAYPVGKSEEDNRQFLRNYRSPNDYEAIIKIQMDYILDSNEHNEVLFLGSSSCLAGARSLPFEDTTGLRAHNLGFPGLIGVRGCNLALRSYLARHSKPRMVVFVVHPWELNKLSLELGPADVFDRFFWCYGTGTESIRPPHEQRFREYVRQGIWTLFGKVTGGAQARLDETIQGHVREGETYRDYERKIRQQRGFLELPDEVMTGFHRPRGIPDAPFELTSENKDGFRVLAQVCRDAGIILLIRFTPVFEGDAPTSTDALQEWSKRLVSEFPHVKVGHPLLLLFEQGFFWDKLHCNGKGAERFTSCLIDDVKGTLYK